MLVRDGELSAGEIASHFEISRPAVSQHLTVLREAGLVDERRNGTRRLYRARPEGLGELKAFLEGFWDERLEALKREAEREERQKDGRRRLSRSWCGARSRSRRARRPCGSSWSIPSRRSAGGGSGPSSTRAGRADPGARDPGQRRERRVRRGRPAPAARLHVGLVGGRRRPGARSARLEHRRDRARARRATGTTLRLTHRGLPNEESAGQPRGRLGQLPGPARGRGRRQAIPAARPVARACTTTASEGR